MSRSPCPRCQLRVRRRPGGFCRACDTEMQRDRRRLAAIEARRSKFDRPLPEARRYLVTAAQNATPVHAGFLAALRVAAAYLDAELVVIPLRYRNPTSVWSARQESDEWWAPEVEPHLFDGRARLGPNLVLVGDVKVQPTAVSPLSGFEALTGQESCIIGATKLQLRCVPAPAGRFPKLLTTTGAVTRPNTTDTKAGKLGAFHHCLGAALVELHGRRFHLRQINANARDGSFVDLDLRFTADGVEPAPPALGLVLGDTHARFVDPTVDRATFGPGGIVETLDPASIVFHDLFDGWAVNPHHEGNPFVAVAKARAQLGGVREEVEHAVAFVRERIGARQAVIVPANHNDFLSRWLQAADWRRSPANAEFYLETALAVARSARVSAGGATYADPFRHWVERLRGDARIRCLAVDERFELGGIECGLHGDRGPNGARGTLRNLSRVGARVVTGHSHTPGINEGHYQCGTSTPLRLEYNHGPSSWLNTHCVIYATGKRALITIVEGEWRAP